MPSNWESEANRVDPDGFTKLEALTKKLLSASKSDVDAMRESEKRKAEVDLSEG